MNVDPIPKTSPDEMKPRFLITFCALCITMLWVKRARAEVSISEFMASNSSSLADEDGEFSDWIEFANPDGAAVDIGGYFLTDDLSDLQKWIFPSGVTIAGDGFRLIFASKKDRGGAGSELHTNFALDADGESIALVAPDGITIVSLFENFPMQRTDISFGGAAETTPLVGPASPIRVHVPNDGSLGTSWRGGAEPFDNTVWTSGTNGVGYDVGAGAGVILDGFKLSTDFDFKYEQDVGAHTQDLDVNAISDFWPNISGELPVVKDGSSTFASGDRYRSDFGNSIIRANFVADESFTIEARLRILNSGGAEGSRGTMALFYRDSDGSGAVAYVGRNETGFLNSSGSYVAVDSTHNADAHHTFRIAKSGDGGVWLWRDGILLNPGEDAMGESSVGTRAWGLYVGDSGSTNSGNWELDYVRITPGAFTSSGGTFYEDFIATDLEAQMAGGNGNPSAYLRIPFDLQEDPAIFEKLILRMRYDDGFVAYLNGAEIARRNAPASPLWNSAASADRTDTDSLQEEHTDVTANLGDVVQGENILAIHALNSSSAADRFLIHAELDTIRTAGQPAFFLTPTPGASNGSGIEGFGGDTSFDIDRGFFTMPIDVAITSSTTDAAIYYTTDGTIPSSTNGTLYVTPVHVATTTPLRAIATKPGFASSNVDTQTYIFLADVLTQTGSGLPVPTKPSVSDWDYRMDPNVVNDPRYAPTLTDDLKELPSLSVVMPAEDMWGANGIHNNPTQFGMAWERACSMEMIYPDDPPRNFQEDCGIRIHGAGSRFRNLGKKSFRLIFRGLYGAEKLEQRFFGPGTPVGFDNIVLRGSYFDSWTVHVPGSGAGIGWNNALQFRTDFGHLTHRDMGAHGVLSNWVHLYINGMYWGIYNTHERPDENFAALHLGGDDSEYDVLKQRPRGQPNGSPPELVSGSRDEWDALMALMSQNFASPAVYAQALTYIDLDQFIDYILMNLYGGNADWPHNNWYAIRRRPTDGPFIFYNWDPENYIFDVNVNRTGTSTNNSPGIVYDRLRDNAEFRLRFADRAREHLFNGGSLTPASNAARFQALVDLLESSMNAESTRWGDTRIEPPLNTIDTWRPTVEEKLNSYFPQRHGIFLNQLKVANLYPDTEPVDFNQHGGSVSSGFALTMTSPDAGPSTIYFTTDGADPRLESGAVSGSAVAFNTPINLAGDAEINARVVSPSGEWSALTQTTFIFDAEPADSENLAIAEIHYRPDDASPAEAATGFGNRDAFEFVEIVNIGEKPVDLTGVRFADGIFFDFPDNANVQPGGRLLVVSDQASFQLRYGNPPPGEIAGEYSGRLSNDGETVTLLAVDGDVIHSLTYDDSGPWPTVADGDGYSIELWNPTAVSRSEAADWRSSPHIGGTPGGTDAVPFSGNVSDDLDSDGLSALLEYIFGSSDTDASSGPGALRADIEPFATGGDINRFLVLYAELNPNASGAVVEVSSNLTNWSSAPEDVIYLGESQDPGGRLTRRYRANLPIDAESNKFIRLRATLTQP